MSTNIKTGDKVIYVGNNVDSMPSEVTRVTAYEIWTTSGKGDIQDFRRLTDEP